MSTFKVGDLVQIVRRSICCGRDNAIGEIYTVVGASDLAARCEICYCIKNSMHVDLDDGACIEPSRLRLIPPLSELESTEREVEHAV